MYKVKKILLSLSLLLWANMTLAGSQYEVTITNITKGQTFTPQFVAIHDRTIQIFDVGGAASDELEILAESGDTGPLTDLLSTKPRHIGEMATIPGLLEPGKSASVIVNANFRHRYLSFAAMLIPTNDTFVGLRGVRLPRHGQRTYTALGYDAGTEANDQNCVHIPGPRCGGEGLSVEKSDQDEGFIYVSNGFHDLGSQDDAENEILGPLVYDWRNPIARINIQRLR